MEHTVTNYFESSRIRLPIDHKKGFGLEEFDIQCNGCGTETECLRGEVKHHSQCVEIEAGGVCLKCKLVTWSRFRFYGDRLLWWGDDEIKTIPIHRDTIWRKILNFFR